MDTASDSLGDAEFAALDIGMDQEEEDEVFSAEELNELEGDFDFDEAEIDSDFL